jgi:GNAT superfamily N-acetyltransferase
MSADEPSGDELVDRPIAPDFPGPPRVGTVAEGQEGWRLSREWGGYPELEWTFGIFRERITAFGGRTRAYFYEDIHDFETTRLLVRLSSVLISQHQPSYPSVGVAFEYFDSAYRVPDGRLLCDDTPFRGRHAVVAWDHADEDEIRFVNSWDPPYWGDGGYGYITREYFDRQVDAVHARWSASGGTCPEWVSCMERAETQRLPEQERLVHCWASARNTFTTQEVATPHRSFTMLHWRAYSMAVPVAVEVIEIRDENEVVGRAHLFHENVPTLRELFVRPGRRREAIGYLLEGTVAEWARAEGHDELRIWLREADARERIIGAPLAFATALGYEWEDVQMRRPNVVKIARRSLG